MGAGYNEGDAMKNHMLHRLAVSLAGLEFTHFLTVKTHLTPMNKG